MKRALLVAALGAAFASSALAETTTPEVDPVAARIVAGAQDADRFNQYRRLKAGCSDRSENWTTSFLRLNEGPVVLAVLGSKPVRDVRRDWSENVSARDWAFVHDTDGDGQMDQMVFNIGPLPMEPEDTTNLPSIAGGTIDGSLFELYFKNSRTAYWQALDLDRDGMLDRVVFPAQQSNGWHSGWVVAGLGAAEGQCRVLDKAGVDRGVCTQSADGESFAGANVTAERWVSKPQILFDAFRKAAQNCKLKAEDFRR